MHGLTQAEAEEGPRGGEVGSGMPPPLPPPPSPPIIIPAEGGMLDEPAPMPPAPMAPAPMAPAPMPPAPMAPEGGGRPQPAEPCRPADGG